ncbi:hypothetical protein GIB67_027219, partial [Kingdonia uniflora]
VFKKFKDGNRNLTSSLVTDVPGMLSLYETTHLKTYGEDIIEEALAFSTDHLNSIVATHSPYPLKKQVEYALKQPYHKGTPRLEVKYYISFSEEHEERNETLLKLAKLRFSIMQSIYLKEMKDLVKAYLTEVKWCNPSYVPTIEEYLSVALITGATTILTVMAHFPEG